MGSGVGVLMPVVAIVLPAAGHGDGGIPQRFFAAVFPGEAFRYVFGAAVVAETPLAAA